MMDKTKIYFLNHNMIISNNRPDVN